MARIRSIKPEFWTSEIIASLDLLDRLMFIGLWNYADDSGRGIDNAALVKAAVFPLDVPVDIARVQEGLRSLHELRLIHRYEVEGRRFLQVSAWTEHQKISHPSESKFPGPDQAQEDSGDIPENIRSLPLSLPPSRARADQGTGNRERKGKDAPLGFAEFWLTYPIRVGKQAATTAFAKALKITTAQTIIDGAARYRDDPNRSADFTKHPATWLKAGCWDDEPLTPSPTSPLAKLQAEVRK